jgi:3-hydroxybutyryl-CoA dehydratase
MEAASRGEREMDPARDAAVIRPGQAVEVQRVFTQEDFDRFARLSGDDNPIHVDTEFAAQTRFGRTLCHGMLLFSAASAVIRNRLPGPGTQIVEQSLKFPGPTYAGDECRIRVEVLSVSSDQKSAGVSAVIDKADGTMCMVGFAEVRLP